ncbi:hypothetical protein E2C01_010210 [Portunus trituberculatus]|uniref:Uncharacterized protein n=1 Tax=Portunus trituberculatus TaxID=210409 RepID=A0A5B7D807_PORTR|nr:hypothetical protein [Portunus trituberculatus]
MFSPRTTFQIALAWYLTKVIWGKVMTGEEEEENLEGERRCLKEEEAEEEEEEEKKKKKDKENGVGGRMGGIGGIRAETGESRRCGQRSNATDIKPRASWLADMMPRVSGDGVQEAGGWLDGGGGGGGGSVLVTQVFVFNNKAEGMLATGNKKKKKKKGAHWIASSFKAQKSYPKARNKCLETSLLKEVKL